MELCQVRPVDRLIPEHAIDGEVLGWPEGAAALHLLRQPVQHAAGDGCRVGAQQVLLRF